MKYSSARPSAVQMGISVFSEEFKRVFVKRK
jgi:hypothetical protein